jgi:hypothetical protein
MLYINCVLFNWCMNIHYSLSISLILGGMDIKNTIVLSKSNLLVMPLINKELSLLGPNKPLYIGHNGVLKYGEPLSHVTIMEVRYPKMPSYLMVIPFVPLLPNSPSGTKSSLCAY